MVTDEISYLTFIAVLQRKRDHAQILSLPNAVVVGESGGEMRVQSVQLETMSFHEGKKQENKTGKKLTQTIFFVTVQYSTWFYKLPRILLPGIAKHRAVPLRLAALRIICTVHENSSFSPQKQISKCL